MRGKLASFARHGLGFAFLLWIPTLYLLHEAFVPAPSPAALMLVFGLGALLQGLLYSLANRSFFIGARPPLQLAAAGVGLALVATVLAGIPLGLHASSTGAALAVHPGALVLGVAQLLVLQFSVFLTRVSFRGLVEFAEAARARARVASRVLLPVGTYHLDRVLARLEGISTRSETHEAEREIQGLVHELRLRWDDRFARFVPWASAALLSARFLEFLAERHAGRLELSVLDRRETLEEIPVRCGTLCALLDHLAACLPGGAQLEVVTTGADGGLQIGVTATGVAGASPEPLPATLLDELRASLQHGVRVSRKLESNVWRVDLWYPPAPPRGPVEWVEQRLTSGDLELLEGGEAHKPKRVYRRGDDIVKVHFDGAFDPKPTLLEDEFYIMRRLSGHGRGFPEITGTGRQPGFHWVSYRFEPGTPLGAWLADSDHASQWLRILLDVHEIMRGLADLGVVHRDLNPGNFIVREDGSLVLIDFDQAVADASEYSGADVDGARRGDAKNDLASFLEQTGLARRANDAVRCFARHWGEDGQAFELELVGHRFPGNEPWDAIWRPILDAVGPLAGRRVLDWRSGSPLFGLFAASHQADVVIRPTSPSAADLVHDLGSNVGGRVTLDEAGEGAGSGRFALAVCLEPADIESELEALPLASLDALVVTWPGDLAVLADRFGASGLAALQTLGFTSRFHPIVLCRRDGS